MMQPSTPRLAAQPHPAVSPSSHSPRQGTFIMTRRVHHRLLQPSCRVQACPVRSGHAPALSASAHTCLLPLLSCSVHMHLLCRLCLVCLLGVESRHPLSSGPLPQRLPLCRCASGGLLTLQASCCSELCLQLGLQEICSLLLSTLQPILLVSRYTVQPGVTSACCLLAALQADSFTCG